jgi:branched-chain amino acid transport system permease protein
VPTARYRLLAFAVGAGWAGMTGCLYAAKMTIISPGSFGFWESVVVFLMVILGGSGSIPGVVLGAAIVVLLPELFRGLESARMLVFGLAMMVVVVFRPQGLFPLRALRFRAHDLPAPAPAPGPARAAGAAEAGR